VSEAPISQETPAAQYSSLVEALRIIPGPGPVEEGGPSMLGFLISYVDLEASGAGEEIRGTLIERYESLLSPEIDLREAEGIVAVQAAYSWEQETAPLLLYLGRFETYALRARASATYEFQGVSYWSDGDTWFLETPFGLHVGYEGTSPDEYPRTMMEQCIRAVQKETPSLYETPGMKEFLDQLPSSFTGFIMITRLPHVQMGFWYVYVPQIDDTQDEVVTTAGVLSSTATGVRYTYFLQFENVETASRGVEALYEAFEEEGEDTIHDVAHRCRS